MESQAGPLVGQRLPPSLDGPEQRVPPPESWSAGALCVEPREETYFGSVLLTGPRWDEVLLEAAGARHFAGARYCFAKCLLQVLVLALVDPRAGHSAGSLIRGRDLGPSVLFARTGGRTFEVWSGDLRLPEYETRVPYRVRGLYSAVGLVRPPIPKVLGQSVCA
jgi:hypothetical protein